MCRAPLYAWQSTDMHKVTFVAGRRVGSFEAEPDRKATFDSSARSLSRVLAVGLGSLPISAHAQYIPPWLIAGVLSPLLVLFLCIVLGFLARSVRTGALHAGLVLVWVVLFTLAAYFVENDYVIWTPLVLYCLHAALLVVLIVVQIAKRLAGSDPTP